MNQRRWQPPPLEPEASKPSEGPPRVQVDEHVVRQILQVNPAMRQGRSTLQVKKALETSARAPKQTDCDQSMPAPQSGDFAHTVGYFLNTKSSRLAALTQEFTARKNALADEEAAAIDALRQEVLSFVQLLDKDTLKRQGPRVFSQHGALLRRFKLDSAALINAIKQST